MTTIEVKLDHRVHPRIIGAKGKNIRKIMDDHKVDIRFPRGQGEDPDVIFISGGEEDVYDCREELLNIEEEFVSLLSYWTQLVTLLTHTTFVLLTNKWQVRIKKNDII